MQPDLEQRFLKPDSWQNGYFTNEKTGHRLHYGYLITPGAKGTVVLLPGLSEFTQKYFETVRDLQARGLSVFMMDWCGQGHSSRRLANPHKQHSKGFHEDADDLTVFINTIVKPHANRPLILLAHSMGANMGMRYVIKHPETFDAIAVTTPLLGIAALRVLPYWLAKILLFFLTPFLKFYVTGGTDWREEVRDDEHNVFSSDPVRKQIHATWFKYDPKLQVGSPTFGWIKAALESCHILKTHDYTAFKTPILIASAGDETIVDNQAISDWAKQIPHADFLEIPGAKHEILMESDAMRGQFWDAFDKFLAENRILS